MTRLPLLCLGALLAYGLAVGCGAPGWIGTPHRPTLALEADINGGIEVLDLVCACRSRLLGGILVRDGERVFRWYQR